MTPLDDSSFDREFQSISEEFDELLMIIPEDEEADGQDGAIGEVIHHPPALPRNISLDNSFTFSEFSFHSIDDTTYSDDEERALHLSKLHVDENFLLYSRMENAATQIQRNFRSRKNAPGSRQTRRDEVPPKDLNDTESENPSDDLQNQQEDEESVDSSNWYLVLFLGIIAAIQTVMTVVGKFCCRNGVDAPDAPVDAINGAPGGNGGGGGGGGGPAPGPGFG